MAGQLRAARSDRAGRSPAVRDRRADAGRRRRTRDGNPFTQQQIADITGQTSVNVNRVLADMERQGLIRRKGRDIEFSTGTGGDAPGLASFQPAIWNLVPNIGALAWWARQGLNL